MTTLDPGQIMLAAALVVGIATACQVVAPRWRIPSLVLLLPAGFLLGAVAPGLRFDAILGPAFPAMVDLVVAVILFQGGLELTDNPVARKDARISHRLVWVGGSLTLLGGAAAANLILGLAWPVAFMLGAIVVVSGPTVVTPLLDFARLQGRVRSILQWEGTLLDPIGALVAVVIFQMIRASGAESLGAAALTFLASLLVGVVAAVVGVLLFVIGGRLVRGSELMGIQVLVGSVVVAAGLANAVSSDAGLLAALLMGFVAPRIARHFGASLAESRPFFSTVVSIGIGVLFVSIAALVPFAALTAILVPTLVVALVLIAIVRPAVVAVCTFGTDLTRRERVFLAGMDPRGIVAAATASSVGASLVALKVPGAQDLLPAAFIIVAVTVTVYGLGAIPLARALGLASSDPRPVDSGSAVPRPTR